LASPLKELSFGENNPDHNTRQVCHLPGDRLTRKMDNDMDSGNRRHGVQ